MSEVLNEPLFEQCPYDKENPYIQVSRKMAQDPSISPKAKGVLLYLLSLPKDWKIYHSHLQKALNVGEDYINSAMEELVNQGYADRTREKIKGIFQPYRYKMRQIKKSLPNGKNPTGEEQISFSRQYEEKEPLHNVFNQTGLTGPENPGLQKKEVTKKTNKLFVCSFDQEKLDLLKDFSLSKKMIEEFCRFTIEELKSSLEAYKQYVDDELSKGNNIDNSIAILRKAIEGRWKPKSIGMKESVKKENIKKNLRLIEEWGYEGMCEIACNKCVFYDKTSLPINCNPKEMLKKLKQIADENYQKTLKNAKRLHEERKRDKSTE